MKVFQVTRRKVRLCHEQLGLVLLGCIATVFLFSGYPGQRVEVKSLSENNFNINDNGVIVVLDIPNTGIDSLVRYIIIHAILDTPCVCPSPLTKCKCLNRQGQPWLFQASNTTGYVCGEHADFTTLAKCPIDYWFKTSGRDSRTSRQYYVITMIRDPVKRYVSQWLALTHQDMFFMNEPRLFRNQSVELQKKGLACYLGKDLTTLSLQDFLNCSDNGARNKQTQMLANMTYVHSLGLSGQDVQEAMLASAKNTLQMLPFFGLFDRPNDTQKILETMLGFKFKQHLSLEDPHLHEVLPLEISLQRQITQANTLDVRLFQFAKELFQERVRTLRFPNSNTNSSTKSLADNFRIVYRPDLNSDTESELRSTNMLTDYDKIEEINEKDDLNFRNGDGSEDILDNDDNKLSKIYPPMEDQDYSDKNMKNDDQNMEMNKYLTENVVTGDEVDMSSPDYKPDVEDVFLFLDRLKKLKKQQKDNAQKMSQAQQQQQYRSQLQLQEQQQYRSSLQLQQEQYRSPLEQQQEQYRSPLQHQQQYISSLEQQQEQYRSPLEQQQEQYRSPLEQQQEQYRSPLEQQQQYRSQQQDVSPLQLQQQQYRSQLQQQQQQFRSPLEPSHYQIGGQTNSAFSTGAEVNIRQSDSTQNIGRSENLQNVNPAFPATRNKPNFYLFYNKKSTSTQKPERRQNEKGINRMFH